MGVLPDRRGILMDRSEIFLMLYEGVIFTLVLAGWLLTAYLVGALVGAI